MHYMGVLKESLLFGLEISFDYGVPEVSGEPKKTAPGAENGFMRQSRRILQLNQSSPKYGSGSRAKRRSRVSSEAIRHQNSGIW